MSLQDVVCDEEMLKLMLRGRPSCCSRVSQPSCFPFLPLSTVLTDLPLEDLQHRSRGEGEGRRPPLFQTGLRWKENSLSFLFSFNLRKNNKRTRTCTAISTVVLVNLSVSLTFVCLSLDGNPFRQAEFSSSTLRRCNGKRRQASEVSLCESSSRSHRDNCNARPSPKFYRPDRPLGN